MKNIKLLKDALADATISVEGIKQTIADFIAASEVQPTFKLEDMVNKKDCNLHYRCVYYTDGQEQAFGNGGAIAAIIKNKTPLNTSYHVDLATNKIVKGIKPLDLSSLITGESVEVKFDVKDLKRALVLARADKSQMHFITFGGAPFSSTNLKMLLAFLKSYPTSKLYVGEIFNFIDSEGNQFLMAKASPEQAKYKFQIIEL